MSKLLFQYAASGSYEPQVDTDECVAMNPNDGYYFHNEDCNGAASAICQLLDAPTDSKSPIESIFIRAINEINEMESAKFSNSIHSKEISHSMNFCIVLANNLRAFCEKKSFTEPSFIFK